MSIINRHTGQIEREGKILSANITLRGTRPGIKIPYLYREFGENIYKATLTTFCSRVDDLMTGARSELFFVEIMFKGEEDCNWKERQSVVDMKEFYKIWNIVDRRVLVEKTGCV